MRQPRIRHNDYSALEVPPLGDWDPVLGVSIVIPAYGHQDKLDLVLAGLAAQSYPDHLMEVIVVDDGSSPPIRLPELMPANTRLVQSAPGGWGSAHAVRTGIAASAYDVILRLDNDMLAYREHVEAHMRWHHVADYLTVLGSLAFTDHTARAHTPAEVTQAVANGKAAELFDSEQDGTSPVERLDETTDHLLNAGNRAFRIADRATISFGRRLYDRAGGLDTALVLGSDTEFGYRLAQAGAVFVPERDAQSWHLGLSQLKGRNEEGRRYRSPYVGQRVPLLKDFRQEAGRQWAVPYVEVVVDVAEATYEGAMATVIGALTGTMTDVAVTLVGPWSTLTDERRSPLDDPVLDLRLLREAFASDGRVRYVESVPETSFPAPFRFRCPAGVVPALDALRRLLEEADERRVGLVLLPIPRDRMLPIARLERTEAVARAIALREGDEDLEDVIHELFGVHWISGTEWALVLANEVPRQVGLLAEVDKWKTVAEQRKTDLATVNAELREWRKVAQTPLKVRLRHAAKRRLANALHIGE
jgi:GT2 family glycosyltransferase